MDSKAIADVIRAAGRQAGDGAVRSRRTVNGNVAHGAADAISTRPEHSINILVAPVGGPEYTGRA